jgi:hypothetical protein
MNRRDAKLAGILILFTALLLGSGCGLLTEADDDHQDTEINEFEFNAYQISGCNSDGLSKASASDSCFDYSFDDTLKIDFCLWGNCCPDSQRFVTDYNIKSDTIFMTVQDTAMDGCWCNCNYTVHVEFSGLPGDNYLFYFNYPGMYFDDSLKYREPVMKY